MEPIAIVGIACRFPGASDYNEFWENLLAGKNSIIEIPEDRWSIEKFYSPDINAPNKTNSKWGGYLDQIDQFDNRFFNISPREVKSMDPQQRVLLEETYHCIEDAGINIDSLRTRKTAVYIGVMAMDYYCDVLSTDVHTDSYAGSGNYQCILANRLSHYYGFKGNSESIDAACASALVVIHNACSSLSLFHNDYAIVAGVSLNYNPWKYISFSKSRMLSPDGQCKTFDKDANGYVPGEGVGVALLQPLSKAIIDKNHIYGVIRGSAVNHVGESASLTAPKVDAQVEVIRQAFGYDDITAKDITYVEAHGTGTSLGDPIEIESLTQAYLQDTDAKQYCKIGSVKTNIGHLEAASGIAGLIKVLMMMKHQTIVPTLNIKTVNPIIDFENSPFKLALKSESWKVEIGHSRIAGVSSFGFGGVNAHIIIEEYNSPLRPIASKQNRNDSHLFILSTKTKKSLEVLIEKWKVFVATDDYNNMSLDDISQTLMLGRQAYGYRCGVIVNTKDALRKEIQALDLDNVINGLSNVESDSRIVLRIGEFSDMSITQVAKYYKEDTGFKKHLNECRAIFKKINPKRSFEIKLTSKWMKMGKYEKAFQFSVQYALIKSLNLANIDTMCGEGLGQWIALCISDIFSFKDCVRFFLNEKDQSQIPISRPQIPYYDQINLRTYRWYHIKPSYLSQLISEIQIEKKDLQKVVKKASLLLGSQFTFKKYMKEWNTVVSSVEKWNTILFSDGKTIEGLLNKVDEVQEESDKILLMFIIISSLRQVNKKWNLSEKRVVENDCFYELIDLYVDGVLNQEDIAQLLSGQEGSIEQVTAMMNEFQYSIDQTKAYKKLREMNEELDEIKDTEKWLKLVGTINLNDKRFSDKIVCDCGVFKEETTGTRLIKYEQQENLTDAKQKFLLKSWLIGMEIDWQLYLNTKRYQKVSLPNYSFDRQRFWIENSPPSPNSSEKRGNENPPRSLLGGDVKKDLPRTPAPEGDGHFLIRKYCPTNNSIIRDHVITGQTIVPGAEMIEFAYTTISEVLESNDLQLMDMKIEAPGIVTTTIQIELIINKLEQTFKITSSDKRLCSGKYWLGNTETTVKDHDSRAIKTLEPNQFYQDILKYGYAYGNSLQVIKGIYVNEEAVVCELEPIAELETHCNPHLLDGVFQSIIVYAINESLIGINTLFVPFSFEQFTLINRLEGKCYVHVVKSKVESKQGEIRTDLYVDDEKGNVLLSIKNMIFKEAPISFLQIYKTKNKQKNELMESVLNSSPATLLEERAAKAEKNKMLSAKEVTEDTLQDKNQEETTVAYYKPIWVGKSISENKEVKTIITIDARKSYLDLIETLLTSPPATLLNERGGIAQINIHFQLPNIARIKDLNDLKQSQENSVLALFRLVKQLMNSKIKQKIQLIVVTKNVQKIIETDSADGYMNAGVYGLAKVINLENKKIQVKLIDVDIETINEPISAKYIRNLINQELSNDDEEVAYRASKRCVRKIHQVDLKKEQAIKGIVPGGVYLVAGGMGWVGQQIIEDQSRRHTSSFVIIGRSVLSEDKKKILKKLNSNKATVVYVQADITDEESVNHAIIRAKKQLQIPQINGVINASGVLRDGFVFNKSEVDFLSVMNPKIYGSWVLSEATKKEPLDFFIIFSSIVSIIGNVGQSDYAAANSFLDSFMAYQNEIQTKTHFQSINWTLWRDGGMGLTDAVIQQLNKTGINPIAGKSGASAFNKISQKQMEQVVVVDDKYKFENNVSNILNLDMSENKDLNKPIIISKDKIVDVLAISLDIPVDDIDFDTDFREMGADSVAIMDIVEELSKTYGDDLHHTVLMEYPTVNKLLQYLSENFTDKQYEKIKEIPSDQFIISQGDQKNKNEERDKETESVVALRAMPDNKFSDKIAIISMAGRFPQSRNIEEFWEHLKNGDDLITEIPKERFDITPFFSANKKENMSYSKWGGFIQDVEYFDAEFFGIKEEDAINMDPQQRIMLELTQELIDRAGYTKEELSGKNVGVFIGGHESNYGRSLTGRRKYSGKKGVVDVISNLISGRISDFYNFKGSAEMIFTACSSALVAIHNGCVSINSTECDLALVGGVELLLDVEWFIGFSNSGALAPDGRCKTFSKSANGFVLGEGAGLVLLKPLQKAISAGDQILGVIAGSSKNNDGNTMGLTTPDVESQKKVILQALLRSDINPEQISYYEAHGTGTILGDPIEVKAMTDVYRGFTDKKQYCAIGSSKSNIGHSLSASGMASLIKVLQIIKHRIVPPSLHCEPTHPRFKFEQSPFYVSTELKEINSEGNVYTALASFGFGGTNCHLVIESFNEKTEGYKLKRHPLVLTKFNKKKFWLTKGNSLDQNLMNIDKKINQPTQSEPQSSSNSVSHSLNNSKDITRLLIAEVAKLLQVEVVDIDEKTSFMELGLTSTDVVSFTENIEDILQIEMYPTVLFEHKNIEQLSQHIRAEYSDELSNNRVIENQIVLDKQLEAYSIKSDEFCSLSNKRISLSNKTEIAIIGVSGRFPGSKNVEEYFQNLLDMKDCISEIPKDRFDWHEYYGNIEDQNRMNSKWGGFVDDIDKFDALFFNISPREAELMDPQQRILLETMWETMEDSGYKNEYYQKNKTGLYVGVGSHDYGELQQESGINIEAHTSTGWAHSVTVNRISFLLGLNGPSIPIETACSSSLVSIHEAIKAIHSGDCELAFVGGVNALLSPRLFISFSKSGMLSPDGHCKTFDKAANGYVRGEGVGVVLLKPLDKAIKDNDQIYGIIKGSAVNHGGKASSLTAPNPISQYELISEAMNKAGVSPQSISYIETHGTGTSLGDPIEIEALKKVFNNATAEENSKFCGLGAVKTKIGHLETAAGIASLIKVLLMFKHKKIPGVLNFKEINPYIDLDQTPLYIVQKTKDWAPNKEALRRVGVSSFGFGGTNAHVILEEYKLNDSASLTKIKQGKFLFLLSAKNTNRLKEYTEKFIEYLNKGPSDLGLQDVCFTLQVGREEMAERLAFVINNKEELIERLSKFNEGEAPTGIFKGNTKKNKEKDNPIYKLHYKQIMREMQNNNTEDQEETLQVLAELWCKGFAIEWEALYQDLKSEENPKRISLPTYPFAKKRYWIEPSQSNQIAKPLDQQQLLHPMIDTNVSTLREQKYKKVLSQEEFYLRDHKVGNIHILPGVAYLEIARAAGELADTEEKVMIMQNILWAVPIEVGSAGKEIEIGFYSNDDSSVSYEVRSLGADGGEESIHSQGKIVYQYTHRKIDKDQPINIEKLIDRLEEREAPSNIYDQFKSVGLNYGNTFQSIKELYGNDKEVLAKLELTEEVKGLDLLVLHPSILDGALQSTIGIREGNSNKCKYLPFSLKEIEIIKATEETCYVYIKRIKTNGDEIKKYDIDICNEHGEILVRIKEFVAKKIDLSQLQDLEQKKKGELVELNFNEASASNYYKFIWESAELIDDGQKNGKDSVLILDRHSGVYAEYKKQNKDAKVILVKPGKKYQQINEYEYEINGREEADYKKIVELMKENDVKNVVHLWNYNEKIINLSNKIQITGVLNTGVYSIFQLSKAMLGLKLTGGIKLLYVSHESLESIQPYNSAISGFNKTIIQENPKYSYHSIRIDTKDIAANELYEITSKELKNGQESEIKYENGQRLVKKISPISQLSNPTAQQTIKNNSVILITGGMGGLGLIFAKYFSEKYKAKLVLTGRSEIDGKKQQILEDITELGGEAIYIKADVSKKEDMRKAVDGTKKHFTKLDGVIHSAGTIKDAFIIKKQLNVFKEVVSPKMQGAINLYEVTKEENLSFIVFFSSIAGTIGNMGQCDYSYVNAFMDEYAIQINKSLITSHLSRRCVSIAWPLWREGGMHVEEAVEKMLKTRGFDLLEANDGLDALEYAIHIQSCQVVVVPGDKKKIYKILGIITDSKEDKKEQVVTTSSQTDGKVQKELKNILSEVLKISETDIDSETDMIEYGVDSIMMMQIMNKIEKKYDETVQPSVIMDYPTIKELSKYLIDNGIVKELTKNITIKESFPKVKQTSFLKSPRKNNRFFQFTNSSIHQFPNTDIAVISVAGRFPGAKNIEKFWENLKAGESSIEEVPIDRFEIAKYFSENKDEENKSYSKWGGFIDDIEYFDADYFGISESDAIGMDPQQRILLELSQELWDRAGYKKDEIKGQKTGVYIGAAESEYTSLYRDQFNKEQMKHIIVNQIQNMMAARISDFYDLKGPAITMDTACSSSLVAIHNACQEIRVGKIESAIAGGIYLILSAEPFIGFSEASVLSEENKSYVFDERASGFVIGEGAGLVLLKSLESAKENGDRILGVIKGSAVNNDGHTMGLTTPNIAGQKEVIKEAIKDANVDPSEITYLEAHGTGTLLGDPIEIKASTQIYGVYTEKKDYCAVGSVKSNIGHIMRAAGIASFIKVILMLQHKQIPATLNCENPHPRFKFEESPFYPNALLKNWATADKLRIAAISSFGFGGTNCHMILEKFDYKTNDYQSIKNSLPITEFNKKKYWVGHEIVDLSVAIKTILSDMELDDILQKLANNEVSEKEASELIHK